MCIKQIFFLGFIFLFVQNLTSAEPALKIPGCVLVEDNIAMEVSACTANCIPTGSTVNQIKLSTLLVRMYWSEIIASVHHPLTSPGLRNGIAPDIRPWTAVTLRPDNTWDSESYDICSCPESAAYICKAYTVKVESCPAVVDYLKTEVYKKKYPRYTNPVLWAWIGAVSAHAQKD